MAEPYTPTTDEIVLGMTHLRDNFWRELTENEIRRGLAAHDREVAARALREAAKNALFGISRGAAIALHHECHKRQCRCGDPGAEELVSQCFLAARDELLVRADQIEKGENRD